MRQITTFIKVASNPLIDKLYKNLSIKGSEAQKQMTHELLRMLCFDEKITNQSKESTIVKVRWIWNGEPNLHALCEHAKAEQ